MSGSYSSVIFADGESSDALDTEEIELVNVSVQSEEDESTDTASMRPQILPQFTDRQPDTSFARRRRGEGEEGEEENSEREERGKEKEEEAITRTPLLKRITTGVVFAVTAIVSLSSMALVMVISSAVGTSNPNQMVAAIISFTEFVVDLMAFAFINVPLLVHLLWGVGWILRVVLLIWLSLGFSVLTAIVAAVAAIVLSLIAIISWILTPNLAKVFVMLELPISQDMQDNYVAVRQNYAACAISPGLVVWANIIQLVVVFLQYVRIAKVYVIGDNECHDKPMIVVSTFGASLDDNMRHAYGIAITILGILAILKMQGLPLLGVPPLPL